MGSVATGESSQRSRAWFGWPLGALALLAWCSLLFIPGFFSLPTIDRDEARFAQASRQMLESYSVRGWVVPMVQERERLNKPPMIYWTQAISAGALTGWDSTRDAIWMYRIPSLIGAIITVLATWRIGCVLFPGLIGSRTGLLAGFLLAAAPIFAWEARQARADQLLVMWTTLTMWLLASAWRTRDRTQPWLRTIVLSLFIAAGVLTKGPITPMVAGLAILALCWWTRSIRWTLRLRPIIGCAIGVAMVLPWILLVGSEVGFSHYWSIVYDEILGRSLTPKEGHFGPPGYHTLLIFALFLPGAMLLGAAMWRSTARALGLPKPQHNPKGLPRRILSVIARLPRTHATGKHEAELFLLAWIIPSWLVFELVSTKLPHYTMPMYPALALLTARCIYATAGGFVEGLDRGIARIGIRAWVIAGLMTLAGGPVFLMIMIGELSDFAVLVVLVVSFVSAAFCEKAHGAVRSGDYKRAQAIGLAIAAASIVSLLGLVLPRADRVFVSHRLAKAIRRVDPDSILPVAAVGFHEDSLIFNTRGRVERLGEDELDSWLDANPESILVLPLDQLANHDARVRVGGFNYSNGKSGTWVVARATPNP